MVLARCRDLAPIRPPPLRGCHLLAVLSSEQPRLSRQGGGVGAGLSRRQLFMVITSHSIQGPPPFVHICYLLGPTTPQRGMQHYYAHFKG